MRVLNWIVLVLGLAATGSTAVWAHDDVSPYELNGKVATGGHDDILASNTVAERVFGFDFGEDPEIPYIIGDPGFNNGAFGIGVFPNDGLLPASFTLGLEISNDLEYWDGTGGVSFAPAPASASLALSHLSSTINIDGTSGLGSMLTIGSSGVAGRLHVHLQSALGDTGGDPADGIYLIGMKLTLPDSGLADSDPIYIVYNSFMDEAVHDQAIDWVQAQLVPEPSTWWLATLGSGAALVVRLRKRRRRRSAAWIVVGI